MRFIILGGGCYGTFYLRQLLRARAAEALSVSEIVVVDHNEIPRAAREHEPNDVVRYARSEWDDFFDQHLATQNASTTDQFVPSPFNPHLGLAWLMRGIRQEHPGFELDLEPFSELPGTPY